MSRSPSPFETASAAIAGERSALARTLSLIERGGSPARAVGQAVHQAGRSGYSVGITGAPGAGKSTLVGILISHLRTLQLAVGVLAIDPSSPYSGGAILGDRVRMQTHAVDDAVFIRSMATRGHLGGLTLAAPEAIRLLIAAGFGLVLVETVGVGQVEVEVAQRTDTTVVVVNPGWGDQVQANKAGLMEIADVFVVNKADRPDAAETTRNLEQMLDLAAGKENWRPPVIQTSATIGDGADRLWAAIDQHRSYLQTTGGLEQRRSLRATQELGHIVAEQLAQQAKTICTDERWSQLVDEVVRGEVDPWAAAQQMLGGLTDRQP